MKQELKTVYITEDGKRFFSESEAKQHEQLMSNTKAYVVCYSPDLNETGNLGKIGYIICSAKWSNDLWVEDYLYNKFGSRIAFVQGVSPTQKWRFERVDISRVDESKILTRINKL
jgi:hypothetical protein